MKGTTVEEMAALLEGDLVPVCGVRWLNAETGKHFGCDREATWAGFAHDEAEDHDDVHLLMCGVCVNMVAGRKCPVDNKPLLTSYHRI